MLRLFFVSFESKTNKKKTHIWPQYLEFETCKKDGVWRGVGGDNPHKDLVIATDRACGEAVGYGVNNGGKGGMLGCVCVTLSLPLSLCVCISLSE